MNFRMGSDPELMLVDRESKKLVSAIPIIKEGKGEGRKLFEGDEDNRVLHDNVLVEFNTRPAETAKEFVSIIGGNLREITKIVGKEGLEPHLQASADYPESELKNPEAKVFGCDPDYDAWRVAINEVPAGAAYRPFRSAGGHLHIGVVEGNEKLNAILLDDMGKISTVKALDIFCGIASVFLDKDPTAKARRQLYGGAGSHRPKPYGVEYRALSNFWLSSPAMTELIFKLSEDALECLVDGNLEKLISKIGEEEIQRVINESDTKKAKAIYKKHILPLLSKKTEKLLDSCMKQKRADFLKLWGI